MSDALNSSSSDDTHSAGPATEAPASSPAENDAPTPPSSGTDAPDAASSTDTVSDRDALLAVVRDAVAPKDKDAAPAAAKPAEAVKDAASDPAAKPAPPDADADPSDAELAAYKPNARKYIAKLSTRARQAREALDAVQPELTAHRELVGYLERHQLAAEDVNLLLGVGAALRRGDYKAFLDGIEPYRQVARQSLGLEVSPDLREQVDEGTISEQAAQELTRTRLEAARHKVEADTQTQRNTTREAEAGRSQMRDAVQSWETQLRSRDPDYALKEALVLRTSQALLAELGTPRSPQDAVQLAQRAYDEVTAQFARARPAPQATRPTPNGASTPSLGATAEPRSLMEAARLGLARAQRGAA